MSNDNPLWFMEESHEITDCKEGSLADQIFAMVDEKLSKEKREVISSIIHNCPRVAELAEGMTRTQHLRIIFSDEVKAKLADNTYKLMKKKDIDGMFKVVAVDSRGRIKAVAGLKLEEIRKGIELERDENRKKILQNVTKGIGSAASLAVFAVSKGKFGRKS